MRRSFVLLFVVSLIVSGPATPASAASTIHVAPGGDDSNGGGSFSDALATIQEAVDRAQPGDTVLVASGTYRGSIDIEGSGTAGAWITVRSQETHQARIEIPAGFEYEYGFRVAADYVEIDGFEVYHEEVGPDHWGAGITVQQSHHTRVLRNHIHDVGGNGIEFLQSDHSTVEGNVVHDAANWAPNQTSGITLYQARAVDDAPGFHNIVRGNVSFGNINLVLRDGETTDGNGIIIDDFRNEHDDDYDILYPHATLIENNLVFDNGGKGIHVFQSDHVLARNNTAFSNNRDPQNPATWRGEFNTSGSSDVTWVNNIAVAEPGSGVLVNNTAFLVGRSDGVTIETNLTAGPGGGDAIVVDGDGQIASLRGNLVGVDPRFVNPNVDPHVADFSLSSASPAVDAGTDDFGVAAGDITTQDRVRGSAVDLGAYEFGNAAPPSTGGGIPPGGILPVFVDIAGSPFTADILWLAEQGITAGCNPPLNDRFCPDDVVTRGQMAAFLGRALDLDAATAPSFTDDDASVFETDIERLAAAGITRGCNPPRNDRFCPDDSVTRGQMAAFLVRALDLVQSGSHRFSDDDDSVFEDDIERLAEAGITVGCNPPSNDRFCPRDPVTRGQMAAFLRRALSS